MFELAIIVSIVWLLLIPVPMFLVQVEVLVVHSKFYCMSASQPSKWKHLEAATSASYTKNRPNWSWPWPWMGTGTKTKIGLFEIQKFLNWILPLSLLEAKPWNFQTVFEVISCRWHFQASPCLKRSGNAILSSLNISAWCWLKVGSCLIISQTTVEVILISNKRSVRASS